MSEGPGGGGEVRKGSGSGKVVKGTERAADYVGGEVMLRFRQRRYYYIAPCSKYRHKPVWGSCGILIRQETTRADKLGAEHRVPLGY